MLDAKVHALLEPHRTEHITYGTEWARALRSSPMVRAPR